MMATKNRVNKYKIIYYLRSKTWRQHLMHHLSLIIYTPKMHFYHKFILIDNFNQLTSKRSEIKMTNCIQIRDQNNQKAKKMTNTYSMHQTKFFSILLSYLCTAMYANCNYTHIQKFR